MQSKDAVRMQKGRKRRTTAGLCVTCGAPTVPGITRCELHARQKSEYDRAVRERNRAQVFTLLGGKCARCGIDDWRLLELDHINGDGAEERRQFKSSAWGSYTAYHRYVIDHINKYQLLCANCHTLKGIETATGGGNSCRWC